jgi:hypothetical protein
MWLTACKVVDSRFCKVVDSPFCEVIDSRSVLLILASQNRTDVNHFTEMCSGSEAGSYLRLIDSCITQLNAQGPSRTCNESKEEETELLSMLATTKKNSD